MPSPFNNTEKGGVEVRADGIVAVTNSVLVCMYCFHESPEGTYYRNTKVLTWVCDGCGETNVVKDIEL